MNPTTEKNGKDTWSLRRYMLLARLVLLGVAIFLIIFLADRVGFRNLLGILSGMSPHWVIAALFFGLLNFMIATVRYRSLIAHDLKYAKVFEVVLASYLLNYASMIQGIGIGAKVGLLKGHRVPASRSLAGAGGEVIFDLLFTGLVTGGFAIYVGWGRSGLGSFRLEVAGIIMGMLMIIGFGVIYYAKKTDFFASTLEGMKKAFSPTHLWINLFSTVGIWFAAAASYYCMMRSLDVLVPPLLPLAAMCVGFVSGLISLVPGGLGVRDLTWAYVCSMSGVSFTLTGTAAIVNRVLIILLAAVVLGILILTGKSKR